MSVEEWVAKCRMGAGTGMEQRQSASEAEQGHTLQGMEQGPASCGMEQEPARCGMERGRVAGGLEWGQVESVMFIDSTWQQARSILRVCIGREGGSKARRKTLYIICSVFLLREKTFANLR